jgi:multidrug efflux pump subunit AcrA (membrane-fusion protein)
VIDDGDDAWDEEDEVDPSADPSADPSGGSSSSRTEKKIEKATARNIDAEIELEAAKLLQEKVVSSISSELELKSLQDQIKLAQAKVERMEEENIGATIKAPVDGTVISLTYSSGEIAAADSSAAIIRIDGKKLTVSFPVSKEQAQKLQVGDEAEPQNYWEYDENFKAILRQITADSSDPQNSRLLKFEIDSAAVTAGDNVQLQIAESSKTYDLVVPNSAVRNDANGTFVLILQTRQSPLGNRYIVTRESVKVLAKDDTNSAISGSIGAYTYVVTTSTRSISSGDQVRLAEEEETTEE